jgi:hypothetical protein
MTGYGTQLPTSALQQFRQLSRSEAEVLLGAWQGSRDPPQHRLSKRDALAGIRALT